MAYLFTAGIELMGYSRKKLQSSKGGKLKNSLAKGPRSEVVAVGQSHVGLLFSVCLCVICLHFAGFSVFFPPLSFYFFLFFYSSFSSSSFFLICVIIQTCLIPKVLGTAAKLFEDSSSLVR